jgi:hypothetical protein
MSTVSNISEGCFYKKQTPTFLALLLKVLVVHTKRRTFIPQSLRSAQTAFSLSSILLLMFSSSFVF